MYSLLPLSPSLTSHSLHIQGIKFMSLEQHSTSSQTHWMNGRISLTSHPPLLISQDWMRDSLVVTLLLHISHSNIYSSPLLNLIPPCMYLQVASTTNCVDGMTSHVPQSPLLSLIYSTLLLPPLLPPPLLLLTPSSSLKKRIPVQ